VLVRSAAALPRRGSERARPAVALDERGPHQGGRRFETTVPAVSRSARDPGPARAQAQEEGIAAVELMAGCRHVNYDAIPNVVYTWPELASVGLSEEERRAAGSRSPSAPSVPGERRGALHETRRTGE